MKTELLIILYVSMVIHAVSFIHLLRCKRLIAELEEFHSKGSQYLGRLALSYIDNNNLVDENDSLKMKIIELEQLLIAEGIKTRLTTRQAR